MLATIAFIFSVVPESVVKVPGNCTLIVLATTELILAVLPTNVEHNREDKLSVLPFEVENITEDVVRIPLVSVVKLGGTASGLLTVNELVVNVDVFTVLPVRVEKIAGSRIVSVLVFNAIELSVLPERVEKIEPSRIVIVLIDKDDAANVLPINVQNLVVDNIIKSVFIDDITRLLAVTKKVDSEDVMVDRTKSELTLSIDDISEILHPEIVDANKVVVLVLNEDIVLPIKVEL